MLLKNVGNIHVIKEALVMSQRGLGNSDLQSFKMLAGMLFGRTALSTFILLIKTSISPGAFCARNILSSSTGPKYDRCADKNFSV